MIRLHKIVLMGAVLALLSAGPAKALTLHNRDVTDQHVRVTEDDDLVVTQDYIIASDQTVELCPNGCTIALMNGAEESFEGYEEVAIEGGHFVVTQ